MEDRYKILSAPPTICSKNYLRLCLFMEQIIYKFKEQRREGRQFAAIVFCSQRDLDRGLRRVNFITEDEYGAILDSDIACVPEYDVDITNYLAARPESVVDRYGYAATYKIHAEEILLRNLDRLTHVYVKKYRELPAHIFIYTWITPCSECSDLIIDKLSFRPYSNIPTTICYTSDTSMRGDDVEQARQKLRDDGFKVEQIPYNYLPIRRKMFTSI